MSFTSESEQTAIAYSTDSATFPALLQLPKPLLEYRIIIAIIKGDVGAVNILKDALRISEQFHLQHILLALGPTTPISLKTPSGSRILWATFNDGTNGPSGPRLTVVPPHNLTDLSLNIERLSKTRSGRIQLLIGDFLDNVLSVSTAPAGLYAFICKLFTRIRTHRQTAFFIATEDMHDPKKTAILKRFADVVIEYRSIPDNGSRRLEARILDHADNHYSIWDNSENPDNEYENQHPLTDRFLKFGRQNPMVKEIVPLTR